MKSPEVDAYIDRFPQPVQRRLRQVRRTVRAVARYAGPKGNLRFPHDQPLPLALISRIVRHRVRQDRVAAPRRKQNRAHRK